MENAGASAVAKQPMKVGSVTIERHRPDLLRGLLAGLVAGLVATYAKDQMQTLWTKVQKTEQPPTEGPTGKEDSQEKKEPTTTKAANAAAKTILHRDLSDSEKEIAGPFTDYAMGAMTATAYGAAAELAPAITRTGGLAFGMTVWMLADELGVPAVGLSAWPNKYPASTHAYALSGHLVYGAVAELVRRIVRKALD